MIYIVTNEEAKQADIDTIKRGTPSLELMERAGRGIFKILQKRIEKNKKNTHHRWFGWKWRRWFCFRPLSF